MTAIDMFESIVVVSAVLSLLCMAVSYVAISGLTSLQTSIAGIPTYTPSSLINGGIAIAQWLPAASVIFVMVLIIFSWMLSAYIKASGLGAVISIAWLSIYTIISFFVSNALVDAVRSVPQFISLGASINFVLLFWANMPLILLFSTIIDIGIAFLALNQ